MHKYLMFLSYIHEIKPSLQSNFCRRYARLIAEAASRGHITCFSFGRPSNHWWVTIKGDELLDGNQDSYYGQAID